MADFSKYDALLNELSNIETRITYLTQHYKNLFETNLELEEKVDALRKENLLLMQKNSDLQHETENVENPGEESIFSSLNSKERESLKGKLLDLISKIDYHLSS